MTLSIDVEEEAWNAVPDLEALAREAASRTFAAARVKEEDVETSILFTGDAEVAALNGDWRGKPYATNVLSFPAPEGQPVPEGELRPLGDIVLAWGVVSAEAIAQGKPLKDHVTHLIIHGLLHLLGHDHVDEAGAVRMEGLECQILKGFGIPDPYDRP